MKVLVINSGSSSLKYKLINTKDGETLSKGLIERIGIDKEMPDHTRAIQKVFSILFNNSSNGKVDSIDAVGHRVVHGGEKFRSSVLVNNDIINQLHEISEMAPLHNPPNIKGIEACRSLMPEVPQVAVFDTAFHGTMEESEFIYALPYEYYEEHSIRKYGFHGTSHKYISLQAAEILGQDKTKIISCHLGNGSSITAIADGKSIATSMGFTPLAGVVMGTRCGDVDPALVTYIMKKDQKSIEEMNTILNQKSGIYGISGFSSDFRDIEKEATLGNERAKLAIETFVRSVKKYIGSYIALLGGLDALIFTAGIGENSPEMRQRICQGMEHLGIKIDTNKNISRNDREINDSNTSVKILIIPTDEEMMIARETIDVLRSN